METIEVRITNLIKALRKKRHYSQAEVAEALSVPLRTYQSWEREYASNIANLERIGQLYGISLESLVYLAAGDDHNDLEKISFPSNDCVEAIFSGATEKHLAIQYQHLFNSNLPLSEQIANCIRDAYFNRGIEGRIKQTERSKGLEQRVAAILELPLDHVRVVQTGAIQFQVLKEMILGYHGAAWLQEIATHHDRFSVGISNGYTIARIMDHLERGKASNFQFFPLNFTMTPADFSITATSLISSFRYRNEGRCSRANPITEPEVYSAMQLADAVIMGIGTFRTEGLYSRMIRATLGSERLGEIINGGAIGDLNYYLLNRDGEIIHVPDLVGEMGSESHAALIKAVSLDVISNKANHGCKTIIAAAGAHKASQVSIAFKHKYANHLLIDSSLAEALLK